MGVREAARQLRQSETKTGTVTEIRRDYNDKSKVRIEVELPMPKRRVARGDKAEAAVPYAPSETVVVSKDFAKGLRIGDQIAIETTVTGG